MAINVYSPKIFKPPVQRPGVIRPNIISPSNMTVNYLRPLGRLSRPEGQRYYTPKHLGHFLTGTLTSTLSREASDILDKYGVNEGVPILDNFKAFGLMFKERFGEPVMEGRWGDLALNAIETGGLSLDYISQPIKSLLPMTGGGAEGDLFKTLGWSQGEYMPNFQWNVQTGNKIADFAINMAGEMASDPFTLVNAVKRLAMSAPKAMASSSVEDIVNNMASMANVDYDTISRKGRELANALTYKTETVLKGAKATRADLQIKKLVDEIDALMPDDFTGATDFLMYKVETLMQSQAWEPYLKIASLSRSIDTLNKAYTKMAWYATPVGPMIDLTKMLGAPAMAVWNNTVRKFKELPIELVINEPTLTHEVTRIHSYELVNKMNLKQFDKVREIFKKAGLFTNQDAVEELSKLYLHILETAPVNMADNLLEYADYTWMQEFNKLLNRNYTPGQEDLLLNIKKVSQALVAEGIDTQEFIQNVALSASAAYGAGQLQAARYLDFMDAEIKRSMKDNSIMTKLSYIDTVFLKEGDTSFGLANLDAWLAHTKNVGLETVTNRMQVLTYYGITLNNSKQLAKALAAGDEQTVLRLITEAKTDTAPFIKQLDTLRGSEVNKAMKNVRNAANLNTKNIEDTSEFFNQFLRDQGIEYKVDVREAMVETVSFQKDLFDLDVDVFKDEALSENLLTLKNNIMNYDAGRIDMESLEGLLKEVQSLYEASSNVAQEISLGLVAGDLQTVYKLRDITSRFLLSDTFNQHIYMLDVTKALQYQQVSKAQAFDIFYMHLSGKVTSKEGAYALDDLFKAVLDGKDNLAKVQTAMWEAGYRNEARALGDVILSLKNTAAMNNLVNTKYTNELLSNNIQDIINVIPRDVLFNDKYASKAVGFYLTNSDAIVDSAMERLTWYLKLHPDEILSPEVLNEIREHYQLTIKDYILRIAHNQNTLQNVTSYIGMPIQTDSVLKSIEHLSQDQRMMVKQLQIIGSPVQYLDEYEDFITRVTGMPPIRDTANRVTRESILTGLDNMMYATPRTNVTVEEVTTSLQDRLSIAQEQVYKLNAQLQQTGPGNELHSIRNLYEKEEWIKYMREYTNWESNYEYAMQSGLSTVGASPLDTATRRGTKRSIEVWHGDWSTPKIGGDATNRFSQGWYGALNEKDYATYLVEGSNKRYLIDADALLDLSEPRTFPADFRIPERGDLSDEAYIQRIRNRLEKHAKAKGFDSIREYLISHGYDGVLLERIHGYEGPEVIMYNLGKVKDDLGNFLGDDLFVNRHDIKFTDRLTQFKFTETFNRKYDYIRNGIAVRSRSQLENMANFLTEYFLANPDMPIEMTNPTLYFGKLLLEDPEMLEAWHRTMTSPMAATGKYLDYVTRWDATYKIDVDAAQKLRDNILAEKAQQVLDELASYGGKAPQHAFEKALLSAPDFNTDRAISNIFTKELGYTWKSMDNMLMYSTEVQNAIHNDFLASQQLDGVMQSVEMQTRELMSGAYKQFDNITPELSAMGFNRNSFTHPDFTGVPFKEHLEVMRTRTLYEATPAELRSYIDMVDGTLVWVSEGGFPLPHSEDTLLQHGIKVLQLSKQYNDIYILHRVDNITHSTLPKFLTRKTGLEYLQKSAVEWMNEYRHYMNIDNLDVPVEWLTGERMNPDMWHAFFETKQVSDLMGDSSVRKSFQKITSAGSNKFYSKAFSKPNLSIVGDVGAYNRIVDYMTLSGIEASEASSLEFFKTSNNYIKAFKASSSAFITGVNRTKKFTHLFFNDDFLLSSPQVKAIFHNATDSDVSDFFSRGGYTAAILRQDKKGLPVVHKYYINNLAQLEQAQAAKAILVHDNMYRTLMNAVNKRELSDDWLPALYRTMTATYKSSYLTTAGFPIRNWLDSAFIRNTNELGSAVEAVRQYKNAGFLLDWHDKVMAEVIKANDNISPDRKLLEAVLNKMPREEAARFKFIDLFIQSDASGGQAESLTKWLTEYRGADLSDTINLLWEQKYYDNVLGAKWNPMSWVSDINNRIEQSTRLALLLGLVEQGVDINGALGKILTTHFDYQARNQLGKLAEHFFWFSTFPMNNFLYYVNEGLERNPTLLKAIMTTQRLSWNTDEIDWEDIKKNRQLKYYALSGSVRIGDYVVKTNFSLMDFLGLILDPFGSAQDRINTIYAVLLGYEEPKMLNPVRSQMSNIERMLTGESMMPSLVAKLTKYPDGRYKYRYNDYTYNRWGRLGSKSKPRKVWARSPRRTRKFVSNYRRFTPYMKRQTFRAKNYQYVTQTFNPNNYSWAGSFRDLRREKRRVNAAVSRVFTSK